MPALATSANKPPNAIYAPAKNDNKIKLVIFEEFFTPAVAEIAFAVSTGLLKDEPLLINLQIILSF